ncbi:MAG: MerR family transcriptional regulator [Polyangiales bacterium]
MATVIHLPLLDVGARIVDESDEPLLQVGELSRLTGKTVRALHLYEELGLLRPHARSKGKFRLYGPDALPRVRWIVKLQETGLTLAEITDLARAWGSSGSAPVAMSRVREVFEDRLAQTRDQLARLRDLESELKASLDYLDVCDSCAPTRVQSHCVSCDLHDCHAPTPELVRGVQVSTRTGDDASEDR